MKQVLQDLANGRTTLADVPTPGASRRGLCIQTRQSLISAGTERMLVEFGRAGWLEKARQQPQKVRQVLDKIHADGLLPAIDAVRSKLDQPLTLGYCNVGTVVEVGSEVTDFAVGDRVVSNGPHAQVVAVGRNLCAKVPGNVSDETAAFTVLASIGLQGMRLAAPSLGESFVVTGLGLIGLLTAQLLQATGCRVLGIDPDPAKCELARSFGVSTVDLAAGEDPVEAARMFSGGRGIDAVLITASTESNQPVQQAARMCRQRGRIVLVGVAGLQLERADFYEKELSFQVSCSYGPGRYDDTYEKGGVDYPYGLVRWTEQRNFEAVLDAMSVGQLRVESLISHRFAFDEAPHAYDVLAGAEPHLGILLQYPNTPTVVVRDHIRTAPAAGAAVSPRDAVVGFIGAGNYAARILIPAFANAGATLHGVASAGGVTAAHFARKFSMQYATTDTSALIADPKVSTVVIATRHDSHARFLEEAMERGKHVFVEKPLAIALGEIDRIERRWLATDPAQRPLVMVGFNRRFAPQVVRMRTLLQSASGPKTLIVTVNAGALPPDHWTQQPGVGGGRLIGEGCHFIDLMRFLTGSPIAQWHVARLGRPDASAVREDKAAVTIEFEDGSVGTLHYLANGHASFPKERVEVFAGGRVLQLDNFRHLRGYGWHGFSRDSLWKQDKGQRSCVAAFVAAVRAGGPAPIDFAELIEVARATVRIGEAARG